MPVIQGVVSLMRDMDQIIEPRPGFLQKAYLLADSAVSYLLLGATQRDYLDFEFYRKSYRERNRFLTKKRYDRMVQFYNNPESSRIFKNKAVFSRVFNDFMKREWLDGESAAKEAWMDFLSKNPAVFIKPREGEKGWGLSVAQVNTPQDAEELYDRIGGQPLILEERIRQHRDLDQMNPNLVNTIRIYTLREEDRVKLISVSLRTGQFADSISDNMSAGGILVGVDPVTGRTVTTGVDKYHRHYTVHPLTKTPLEGFQIPSWPAIQDVMERAAQVVPDVRYIGWDITVNQDGEPVVIEGNHNGGRRALQSADQVGRYPLFQELQKNH